MTPDDPFVADTHRWWHLSGPSPELLAAEAAREAARALNAGGRLLLRMCLRSAGVPNGLDEGTIRTAFPRLAAGVHRAGGFGQ